MSDEATDLISRCLVKDPNFRISAADALRHPFFWERGLGVEPMQRVFQGANSHKMKPKILEDIEGPSSGVENPIPHEFVAIEQARPSSNIRKLNFLTIEEKMTDYMRVEVNKATISSSYLPSMRQPPRLSPGPGSDPSKYRLPAQPPPSPFQRPMPLSPVPLSASPLPHHPNPTIQTKRNPILPLVEIKSSEVIGPQVSITANNNPARRNTKEDKPIRVSRSSDLDHGSHQQLAHRMDRENKEGNTPPNIPLDQPVEYIFTKYLYEQRNKDIKYSIHSRLNASHLARKTWVTCSEKS